VNLNLSEETKQSCGMAAGLLKVTVGARHFQRLFGGAVGLHSDLKGSLSPYWSETLLPSPTVTRAPHFAG
jgi:hypothetical protein